MWRPKICYKGSSGMGGGGGGGASAPISKGSLPSISGSAKQVSWAEDIRADAVRDFNEYSYSANKVLAGKGGQSPNGLRESQTISSGNYAATYQGVVRKMTRRMMKFVDGRPEGKTESEMVRDTLKKMRKNITTRTDARYWIDRR